MKNFIVIYLFVFIITVNSSRNRKPQIVSNDKENEELYNDINYDYDKYVLRFLNNYSIN